MDKNELVISIKNVIKQIVKENDVINLFMLLKDKNKVESYTVIVSAKWLDSMEIHNGTKKIIEYFIKGLKKEELRYISRVNVVKSSDSQVISINKAVYVSGGQINVNNSVFGNVIIPSAIILESSLNQEN